MLCCSLADRLAGFWLPDEVVLYIGRAGPRKDIGVSELSDRVDEYYTTPLGARSPHAGRPPTEDRWPIFDELHVHYAYRADFMKAEERMLDRFAEQLSRRDTVMGSTTRRS